MHTSRPRNEMISFHIWSWELHTIQLQASDIIAHTLLSITACKPYNCVNSIVAFSNEKIIHTPSPRIE